MTNNDFDDIEFIFENLKFETDDLFDASENFIEKFADHNILEFVSCVSYIIYRISESVDNAAPPLLICKLIEANIERVEKMLTGENE